MNALIITAKPGDFPMIEELVKKLDMALPESKVEPRVYKIENVRALDLANLMNNLFDESSTTGGGRRGFIFSPFQDQQQGITGLSGKVKLIADTTTNALIAIASTPRAFKVIEKLIKELDIPDDIATTKVFHLDNANADYLADQLNALFEDQTGGGWKSRIFLVSEQFHDGGR